MITINLTKDNNGNKVLTGQITGLSLSGVKTFQEDMINKLKILKQSNLGYLEQSNGYALKYKFTVIGGAKEDIQEQILEFE